VTSDRDSDRDSAAPGASGLAIEGPDYSPGFWLWHATLRWQREVTAALAPSGLTHVQFVLLSCAWWLHEHGVVPNQLQLARQAGTDVKMTSQVVRKLEAKGLIERETDRDDTRAKRLRITAAGIALALSAIGQVENADAAFFRPLTSAGTAPAEITALLRHLAG
jgi:DNA-binding MarR family transcriptional regulator